jgi:hypothetical protein
MWDHKHPENETVADFVKCRLKKCPHSMVLVSELFDLYKKFLKGSTGKETLCMHIGFGMLLRKATNTSRFVKWHDGNARAFLKGYKLK